MADDPFRLWLEHMVHKLYQKKLKLNNEREERSQDHMSQEIRKLLQQDPESESTTSSQEVHRPHDLPIARIQPITDQLLSLETTLNAYSETLKRCRDNLQNRIRSFPV